MKRKSFFLVFALGMILVFAGTVRAVTNNPSAESNIALNTWSNANYSLSVDVDTFQHRFHPSASMSNETIWIQGGNLIQSTKFMGDGPIYLYGSLTTFRKADDDNAVKITDNVGFKCDIPFAQIPGYYRSIVHYQMFTQK